MWEQKEKIIKGIRGKELTRGWRERQKESNVIIILIKFSLKIKQNKKSWLSCWNIFKIILTDISDCYLLYENWKLNSPNLIVHKYNEATFSQQ